MALIPISTIKTYAEAAGHSNLDEDALLVLSRECEYKLRLLIQESKKYMYHSKRNKLTIDDLNLALSNLGETPLLGYDGLEALQFKQVSSNGPSAISGNLWMVPGEEVSLEDVLSEPLPKAPNAVVLTGHWLAIEGVQPQIPENPNIHDRMKLAGETNTEKMLSEGTSPTSIFGALPRKTVIEEAEVKPLVKHVLSKEHQLYFDTITNDLMSGASEKVEAAILSLSKDAGLQQLVPYFVQYVAELVPKSIRDPSKLLILIRVLASLFGNEHLLLEPYLHQMMPPVLTCVVGKKLCDDPEKDNRHWKLREEAGQLVAAILSKYSSVYQSLLPRVTKTLTKGLLGTSEEPPALTSQYGSIIALALIGPHCIECIVTPHAKAIHEAAIKAGNSPCAEAVIYALKEKAGINNL